MSDTGFASSPGLRSDAHLDPALCRDLVKRRLRGEHEAGRELLEHVHPYLVHALGRMRLLAGARARDGVEEVIVAVLCKLSRDDGKALHQFDAWATVYPDRTFQDWLTIVATNAARAHMRRERGRSYSADIPSRKRLLNELTASLTEVNGAVAAGMTPAQTAREILEFAASALPADQWAALRAWLEGADFEEVASEIGVMDAQAAQRLVRAAIATLRRRFAGK